MKYSCAYLPSISKKNKYVVPYATPNGTKQFTVDSLASYHFLVIPPSNELISRQSFLHLGVIEKTDCCGSGTFIFEKIPTWYDIEACLKLKLSILEIYAGTWYKTCTYNLFGDYTWTPHHALDEIITNINSDNTGVFQLRKKEMAEYHNLVLLEILDEKKYEAWLIK